MTKAHRFEEKEKELKKKMRALKIYFKDVKEQFVRSSGPGGQNVNKVSSCVVLHHIPSGIQVKCQKERTQALNRHKAFIMLVDKFEKKIHLEHVREQQAREKLRRKNRKKPHALKEKILEDKHRQSDKKKQRRKMNTNTIDDE